MSVMQVLSDSEKVSEASLAKAIGLENKIIKKQEKFQQDYNKKVDELERTALLMARGNNIVIKSENEDLDLMSHDDDRDPETAGNNGPNFSSVIFNNSLAETIDTARLNEVARG